jgi:hypothetical protein
MSKRRMLHFARVSAGSVAQATDGSGWTRQWDSTQPTLGWVLLTSSAGSRHAGSTQRHCVAITRSLGYGGVDVGFLSNYDPAASKAWSGSDAVSDVNDGHLQALARDRDLIILAWGPQADPQRAHHVAALLWRGVAQHGGSLAVLGWTPGGQPVPVEWAPKTALPLCLSLVSPQLTPAASCDYHDTRFDQLLIGGAA